MTRILIFLLTFLPVFGQFGGLATTDDGKQLYFSSSLQLNGTTNENAYEKIFRYDATGIRLVAQMDRIAITPGFGTPESNPYNLGAAYVSGNGSVFGYVGYADCNTGVPTCYYAGLEQTTLQYSGSFSAYTLPYGCSISKNARYAACITGGRVTYEQYGVFDLFGLQKPIFTPPCGQSTGRPLITSDGHTLCGNNLTSASGSVTLQLPGTPPRGLISDDGSRIVSGGTALSIYDVAAGTTTAVTLPNAQPAYPWSLSNDARVILILFSSATGSHAGVIRADGSGFLQFSEDIGIGTGQLILSGDGSTAYGVTASGRLLKFDTATGASTVVASAAQLFKLQGAAVAGSITSIQGTGLADSTVSATALPLSTSALGGAQVTVNGTLAPLLSVSPTLITFQIPWATPVGSASIAVVRTASAFAQPAFAAQILATQPFSLLNQAISQDFTHLNAAMQPANPGEVVNFYLTGLGSVTVPVADGAPGPSGPLALVAAPVTVLFGTTPLQVLYAGLAPGTVGIDQLSVQLPALIAPGPFFPPGGGLTQMQLTINSLNNILPAVWSTTNQ